MEVLGEAVKDRLNTESDEPPAASVVLGRAGLNDLITSLAEAGYRVKGPVVRDGSVTLDDITSDKDLPVGWRDAQEPGEYRLRKGRDQRVFGFVVGPESLKRFLFVPRRRVVSADRQADGTLGFTRTDDEPEPVAVLGARPCDVAGMLVQDRVFMDSEYPDPDYVSRRKHLFVVAVNCSHPSDTCFCTSMGTGPRASKGFDLALTELYDRKKHEFLVESGSDAGSAILEKLETRPASQKDLDKADAVIQAAVSKVTKQMDTDGIRDLLLGNLRHPEWADVGDRCLNCANCTMVCPTCFCSRLEEVTDLTGDHAERWQSWDSCFAIDHSYIHGGAVRKSSRARYRQWMTHKLASWIDQFGTSGCTGLRPVHNVVSSRHRHYRGGGADSRQSGRSLRNHRG